MIIARIHSQTDKLPKKFMGYLSRDLLKIWAEIQTPVGTQAPIEMIKAMDLLLKAYRLGLFEVTQSME